MNHRFRSDVQAVRGFLAGGDIGVLQAIRGGWYTFQPSRQLIGWRLRRQEAGRGALLGLRRQLPDLRPWLPRLAPPERAARPPLRASTSGRPGLGAALVVSEGRGTG